MKKYFSFEGRIRRSEYFVIQLIAVIIVWVTAFISMSLAIASGDDFIGIFPVLFLGVYVAFFWVCIAAGAKRCHDRGNSGFFQLIPFYGFWMLFADGEYGSNQYGPDPKNRVNQNDYHRQTA